MKAPSCWPGLGAKTPESTLDFNLMNSNAPVRVVGLDPPYQISQFQALSLKLLPLPLVLSSLGDLEN